MLYFCHIYVYIYIYSNLQKDRKEDIYRDLRGFYSSIFLLFAICYVYIYIYTLCKISPIQLGKPGAWVVIPEIDRVRWYGKPTRPGKR